VTSPTLLFLKVDFLCKVPHVGAMKSNRIPTDIVLHRASRTLEVVFSENEKYHLSWEYLRLFSPSKEVRARHGKERILVSGKQDVVLEDIAPIGNYAVKLFFDDGHKSGLYDWGYLRDLGKNHDVNWRDHLERMEAEDGKNHTGGS
jgi:DUF971 family protein